MPKALLAPFPGFNGVIMAQLIDLPEGHGCRDYLYHIPPTDAMERNMMEKRDTSGDPGWTNFGAARFRFVGFAKAPGLAQARYPYPKGTLLYEFIGKE